MITLNEKPNDALLQANWTEIVSIAQNDVNSYTNKFSIMFYDDEMQKYISKALLNVLFANHYFFIVLGLVGPILYYSFKL